MIRAICYKEWIKTRRAFLLSAILLAAYVAYALAHTGSLFRVNGAVAAWGTTILKETFLLPSALRWIPLATALVIGLAQFVPELAERRLKLTLHLPLPETRVLSIMLLHGLALLLALHLATTLLLWLVLARYYPAEILLDLGWRALPWFAAALPGYLFAAWACIEPSWIRRVTNALAAAGALSACYLDAPAGSYLTFLPCLALLVAAAFCAPFQAAARFKEGIQ
ncbi:MAG: hypothetical protein LBG30_03165 [Odoribacteraceae bacterium]|jgi:hypothetical protein|nr:hypothetical protein [Odoribacteraceae bacterium]